VQSGFVASSVVVLRGWRLATTAGGADKVVLLTLTAACRLPPLSWQDAPSRQNNCA